MNLKDEILTGLTFEELILTINCNEKEKNTSTVLKVYNELLIKRTNEARFLLSKKLDLVLKEIQE